MNATSLYVSTSRLVFQNDYTTDQNWMDLYRLVPYLRQSLSCTVCGNLLIEPHTPVDGHCQHHVCKMCIRGRKNLKPACNWCKDYDKYEKNMTLRILLQCYKSLCEHIMNTPIYNMICKQNKVTGLLNNGVTVPSVSLVEFIEEGANFQDVFKSNSGLTKNAYSILPCVFNSCPPPNINNSNSGTHTQNQHIQQQKVNNNVIISPAPSNEHQQKITPINHLPPIKTVSNGSAMYSVLYTGIGNKITIKRKTNGDDDVNSRKFQQIVRPKSFSKRRGCRCGNATATPGKLTCCGQRCPCYVDQKSCIDCKCRGCRNPHRPDGGKVRPHIPELACYEIQVADDSTTNLTSSLTPRTNCVKIPIQEFGVHSRLNSTKTTSIDSAFDDNHQIRQSLTLGNVSREPLLISSSEVINVFTSTTAPPPQHSISNHHSIEHHSQLQYHTRNNSHQIPEISTTLPQIILQKQEPVSLSPPGGQTLLTQVRPATITKVSSESSSSSSSSSQLTANTITLSPIIVNNSNSFASQIFDDEEIITTQCSSSPIQSLPLVELTSNDKKTCNNI